MVRGSDRRRGSKERMVWVGEGTPADGARPSWEAARAQASHTGRMSGGRRPVPCHPALWPAGHRPGGGWSHRVSPSHVCNLATTIKLCFVKFSLIENYRRGCEHL